MENIDNSKIKCSFCGKTQGQVKKLIAGPDVYICDECVNLCCEIIDNSYLEDDSTIAEQIRRFS
ncbi:hypothetical protein IJ182_02485 [bacterium]|nr:hypothetical protein [bacterium]